MRIMAWSVILLTGALGILHNGALACPAECVCSNTNEGLLADCSSQRLDQVPAGLPQNITILDFSRNFLGRTVVLSNYQLHQLENLTYLDELRLPYNNLQLFYNDAFPNLTTTRRLILANNIITRVPTQAFTSLPNLQYLDMSNNLIASLERRVFLNQYLTEVILQNNFISSINVDSFKSLSNLLSLNLLGNLITNVSHLFQHLSNIRNIDLSRNSLEKIDENIFAQNILLEIIALDNNNISFLDSGTFLSQQNLKVLSLHFNNLDSSVFNVLNFLPNLTGLFLQSNGIEKLPRNAFISNPNLLDLNLSNNDINEIHPETFTGLIHLKTLQLSRNKLQFVAPDVFNDLPDSASLCLADNPWICNCSIVYLQESLQRFQQTCEEPKCTDGGNLTFSAAWKLSSECGTNATVSMTTAEITFHSTDLTTSPDSRPQKHLSILVITSAVMVLLILIIIVICCYCARREESKTSATDEGTNHKYWENTIFPTRRSRTSARLQERNDQNYDKRKGFFDRVKDIVQRPFSTASLKKSEDHGGRTASLFMDSYLEAGGNAPKKTNSYNNTVIGMDTVTISEVEEGSDAKSNPQKVQKDSSPQGDGLGGELSISNEEKDKESKIRQEFPLLMEATDSNIITKADLNVPMSSHNTDEVTYAEIKGGVQDKPLPPIPDETYETPKDENAPIPFENKTAESPKEEGMGNFTENSQDTWANYSDDDKTSQKLEVIRPPSAFADELDLDLGKQTVTERELDETRKCKIHPHEVSISGSPQGDGLGGAFSSSNGDKDEKSNNMEATDSNIITKADVNVSMSLNGTDEVTYTEITGEMQDKPLPPIPDETNETSRDKNAPFPLENKTAESPTEGGMKDFTENPQDTRTKYCDNDKRGQRSKMPTPPSTPADEINLNIAKDYINRQVIDKHQKTSPSKQ